VAATLSHESLDHVIAGDAGAGKGERKGNVLLLKGGKLRREGSSRSLIFEEKNVRI